MWGDRNQQVLHSVDEEWNVMHQGEVISGGIQYSLIRCKGCDSVALRREEYSSEVMEDGSPNSSIQYYPPAIFRPEPKWFDEWKNGFSKTVLKEVYIALQNGLLELAVLGIRTSLENTMVQEVGDQGSFSKNIQEFTNKGFISPNQKQVLEAILEVGSATTHRAFQPSNEEVLAVVDMSEVIFQTVYLHRDQARKVMNRIPPRGSRGTGKNGPHGVGP